MQVDKSKLYSSGSFTFKNFINLNKDEIMMILNERNHPDVKKWMLTKENIKLEDHIKFIESLNTREDAFYWLIIQEGKPIGVLSLIHCDYEKNEAEPGYYLFANHQDSGIGLELHFHYKNLFFNILQVDNLFGNLLHSNEKAIQLSYYFGAIYDSQSMKNGEKYLQMHTPKVNFNKISEKGLVKNFIKFIKENPELWTSKQV